MPSRELLSDAQRQALLTAHYDLDRRMMVRYWTLSYEDLDRIRSRRGDENRLGFAVQLCLLRFPGWPLKPNDEVPNQLVRFVADQLHLDPASADVYAARDTTRRQHLSALQREYGFSAYHRDTEQQLAAWLLPVALRREAPWFLVTSVVERLREQRVVLPAMSTLESLVIKVRRRAEESIFLTLTQSLSPEQRNALDVLLYQETDRAKGVANLRRPPGAAIPASILDLMDRIDLIRAVGLRSDLDQSLSPGRLRRLSSRAARHTLQHLREYAPMKRHALVVALLLQTGQDFTDETMDMQARLIGRLFNRAERQETELQQENPSIRQQLRQYTKLGKALLSARAKNQAWNKLWKPAQDGITWHRASQRQSASPIPLAPASSTCVRIGHRSGNTVLAF